MADNFRNKQWFKNLSQDRKDEICKKFDIDEKTLKKAGRETSDGQNCHRYASYRSSSAYT